MRGPLRLPFPLVIIIVARKTHARRNATVVCYKRRGTQCHISCYYCEPKTQGEHNAPHLLFVVGFAIKNMHTYKQ